MRRREFVALLGAWPLAALAQPKEAALPVVGLLSSTSPQAYASRIAAFRQGLNSSGYVEGRNVMIDYRWA